MNLYRTLIATGGHEDLPQELLNNAAAIERLWKEADATCGVAGYCPDVCDSATSQTRPECKLCRAVEALRPLFGEEAA